MSDKPIFKTLWAERGAKQEVDTSKIALGWTAERPPFQWENWSQWRQDAFIAHINVRGIPEWDEETEYGVGVKSYVAGSNGEVYVSIAPSGGTYPARDPVMDVIKWKKAWLDADGTIGIPKVIGLQQALDNKVDKRNGYELSSNDYTSIEKSKLGGIESNAQRNVPANLSNSRTSSSVTIASSSGTDTTIGGASQTVSGVMVATDKAKLDGLPTGAGGLIPLAGGGTGSSNAAGARLALQLGDHSTHNYGTTANTVMMGNDSRVIRVNQDIAEGLATKADKTINISTGVGLSGGGNLSTNRTISTIFGTTANTSAMGNDSRIVNAASVTQLNSGLALKADRSVRITAGDGLVGGGSIESSRTISLDRTSMMLSVWPVGIIYTQYPNTPTPQSLLGGSWKLLFNNESAFFRTEGVESNTFESGIQQDAIKSHGHLADSASSGGHTHTVSGTAAAAGVHTHPLSGTAAAAGAHTHTIPRSAGSNNTRGDFVSPANRSEATTTSSSDGAHTHSISGTATSGGAHTHTVSGTAASNGAHSHTITVRNTGTTETRPKNHTIRVWQRTA